MTARRPPASLLAVALVAVALAMPASSRGVEPDPPPMQREVYGFFLPGNRAYMLETADYSVLTTVAYFALEALPNGSLRRTDASGSTTSERRGWESAWLQDVIAKAHGAGAKVELTIARFGWSAAERDASIALLSDAVALDRLVDEIADEVVDKGVDGVNIDFEPMYAEVDEEFVGFLRALRAELDKREPGLSLTFDSTGYGNNYRFSELLAEGAADAVYIMAYPFHTRYSERAGAISPMAGLSFDVTEAVDKVLRHTTPDKVILGLPNYGFRWPTRTKERHALTRSAWETYGKPRPVPVSVAADLAAQHGRRWDAEQLVPWVRWRGAGCSGCSVSWQQLYYDDTQSMTIKYDFANERDLGGVGIWRLNYGPDRADFYTLLRDSFGSTQVTQ